MMPQLLLSESTVNVLAQVVLHFLWQGSLLAVATACLLHVSPIRTARARYAFYCGLLMLFAICPLVTWRGIYAEPVAKIEIQAGSAGDRAAFANAQVSTAESVAIKSNSAQSNAGQSMIRPPDSRLHVARAWLARERGLIVITWLAGVCFMATRLLLGAIGVCMLARRRKPIPPAVACLVERLSRRLAFHVPPAVHVVERISQAMAVGIFKPMVLLPASWISELPSEVLEAVIAHELAHLRRWDLPINFMQRVVETLLFFHPAVWWCSRRLRMEREMCCDELAQATIGNRVVYAKALAYLAHQQCSTIESLLAAGIGGKKMVLLERIRNVLGMVPGRHGRLYGPSCALVGAVVTSLAWIAVFGLPAQWQSRASSTDDQEVIVVNAEPSTPPEAAKPKLPDAIEQGTPLDEVAQVAEPLTLENLKSASYWDLSLEEAIKTSKANSKVPRSRSGHEVSHTDDNSSQTSEAQQTNGDLSPADFEIAVRNLVNDTKNSYWELSFAYRNLETSNAAQRSAQQTWKKIHRLYIAGAKDGEAKEEGQAREQYFQFKSTTQTLLNELFRAENRLRYVLGISPTDGRLIRPIDKPTATKFDFDWSEITEEALSRSPELRRQKWRVKQQEVQFVNAKHVLQTRLDLSGTYRWQGITAETFETWQSQEFTLGVEMTLPLGFRKELSTMRFYQLRLARERAKLRDEELEVSHQLADAVRQLELNYELTQTNFKRTVAADRQVEAVQAAFEAETVTVDQLLEAQRRRAESQTSFYRTLYDYQRAIIAVQLRKGSLL